MESQRLTKAIGRIRVEPDVLELILKRTPLSTLTSFWTVGKSL